jgi:hypothetical protein
VLLAEGPQDVWQQRASRGGVEADRQAVPSRLAGGLDRASRLTESSAYGSPRGPKRPLGIRSKSREGLLCIASR